MQHAQQKLKSLLNQLNTVIVGKSTQVQDCVACLLAGGHLLIEDVPGVGKTTLAHALAHTFGLQFSRVQFTSDLMPSDVSGHAVYDPKTESFKIRRGPVFTNLLLADEINRAPAKTQSALLEVMQEGQVTIEGKAFVLSPPFLALATQNPVEQEGTYPLPEAQLDRFLLRLALGYPDAAAERALLSGVDRRDLIAQVSPLLAAEQVISLRRAVQDVHASDALIGYVQALVSRSRSHPGVRVGLSPRAGLALLKGARAHALLLGRDHVLPEDVQALFAPVASHRLVPEAEASAAQALAKSILHAVAVD